MGIPNKLFVTEQTQQGPRQMNLYSRMLDGQIIFLNGEINEDMAESIIAQLLYLEAQEFEGDIRLYINSLGGVITAGLAIYDTMQCIRCNVATICVGQAASMAAILLAGGTKGKRMAFPNARMLIHQPLGGAQGQASDIQIQAKRLTGPRTVWMRSWSITLGSQWKSLRKIPIETFSFRQRKQWSMG